MSYPVTYYCPHCETLVELQREGYLADKAVTPFPFEGWEYARPDENFENADGVVFVCGESRGDGVDWRPPLSMSAETGESDATANDGTGPDAASGGATADEGSASRSIGCGRRFYLSFVRYEDGREVDPRRPTEYVTIGSGTEPRGPRGPQGPSFWS